MIDSTNIYSAPPLSPQQKESNKISYWLSKLFYQEKERNKEILNNISENKSAINKEKQISNINEVKKVEADKHVISDMVQNSNEILMSITSAGFPFDFFPTTINVEASRVTIITRQLFSSQVHSVDIKDISSVFIETGILFAAITLISKIFSQKELVIDRLWKKEAILLRRVIEGLRMFEKEEINITKFSKEELLSKLEELSTTKIVL
ncbi:MAG: hypothetical protein WC744_05250 [Patescibacteria group bacterium]|jgi:hypothetical protein